ncbi:MAG: isochorismate synthase [Bacteroidota bacterium]
MPLISDQNQRITSCFAEQLERLDLKHIFDTAVADANHIDFLSLTFSIPSIDALAVLEQYNDKDAFNYYWEHPEKEFAMVAGGSLYRIQVRGPERFREASKRGKELVRRIAHSSSVNHRLATVHLLGGFSFLDENTSPQWEPYGSGSFTLPEWHIVQDGNLTLLTINMPFHSELSFSDISEQFYSSIERLEQLCNAKSYAFESVPLENASPISFGENESEYARWIHMIDNARELIHHHAFDKIVLANERVIELTHSISPTLILNRLRNQYPNCYSFLIRHDDTSSFIGCTPERLASFSHHFVFTEGLAGSTSRGASASEDAVLEHQLLHSEKDLREHAFVIDAIEKNLSEFSEIIEHPVQPSVKKLSNVQHLFTPIRARIEEGASRTALLQNLHPTPAVGGHPKEKAVPFITELESFDRGWYAAPLGWINAHGEGEFVVAIRSGLIGEKEVRFFAGCGIVEDSDSRKEWEEMNLKLRPMLSALHYAANHD